MKSGGTRRTARLDSPRLNRKALPGALEKYCSTTFSRIRWRPARAGSTRAWVLLFYSSLWRAPERCASLREKSCLKIYDRIDLRRFNVFHFFQSTARLSFCQQCRIAYDLMQRAWVCISTHPISPAFGCLAFTFSDKFKVSAMIWRCLETTWMQRPDTHISLLSVMCHPAFVGVACPDLFLFLLSFLLISYTISTEAFLFLVTCLALCFAPRN